MALWDFLLNTVCSMRTEEQNMVNGNEGVRSLIGPETGSEGLKVIWGRGSGEAGEIQGRYVVCADLLNLNFHCRLALTILSNR